ncbi:MAG: hypothetical protein OET90_01775 [Desulfuromonadales bacterium]|nr:hypothetical protein [Desulfuromonadales bacterium]
MSDLLSLNKILRILTVSILAVLGTYWLVGLLYAKSQYGIRLNIPPLIILLILHLIGVVSGCKKSLVGLSIMILFTFLSLIAPYFLAIPFTPSSWMLVSYLALIFLQLVRIFLYSRQKRIQSLQGA